MTPLTTTDCRAARKSGPPRALPAAVWATVAVCLLVTSHAHSLARGLSPSRSRLGINLTGLTDWNTEFPFVDLFRTSRPWISQQKGKPWGKGPPLDLDQHGWVRSLQPDCWAETLMGTHGHYPPGQYVCLYDGVGTIELRNIKREIERSPGRIVFEADPSKGAIFLRITATDPRNYVRNIRVIMPGFEKTYATQIFNPVFLNRWASFNTFRFMDWMKTNGSRVETWDDRPRIKDATWMARGAPIEVMVELCNRTGLNPWFCIPHRANDDYVRRFAELVKAKLRPDLRVYIEYSNEVWNSMFPQTKYCNEQGMKLGLASKPWEAGWRYSAWRSVQIFKIWAEVFGGTERLVRVISGQAANPYVCEQKLSFHAAYNYCDALAIAPYFGPVVTPDGKPAAAEVARWTVNDLLNFVQAHTLPRAVENMRRCKAVADKYGVKLVAYEAGQHLVGARGAENNEALTRLFHAANRSQQMGTLYTKYLDAWADIGGDLCCLYSSVGTWSKWGSWGLLEHNQDRTAKYEAVVTWNEAHPLQ